MGIPLYALVALLAAYGAIEMNSAEQTAVHAFGGAGDGARDLDDRAWFPSGSAGRLNALA